MITDLKEFEVRKFLIIVFSILAASVDVASQIQHIKLQDAFEIKQQINLSEIAGSVEYVKLETNPACRCGPQVRLFCNEKYIIAFSVNNIFLFDRKTGAFVTEIGKTGHIFSTYYVIPFDEQRNLVTYKSAPNTIAEFTLMNHFLKEIKLPLNYGNSVYWKKGIYIQFVSNISGNDNRRLILFTENSSVIKVHRNNNKFVKSVDANYYSNQEGGFYWFNRNLYFKETFVDTIYQITEEKLIPIYFFDEGHRGLNYSMKGELDLKNKHQHFFISNIYETEDHLFFNLEYQLKVYTGIYFKKKKRCEVTDLILVNRSGFFNDIDVFIPLHFSSVNSENELIGSCIPAEIKKWKNENTLSITDEEKLKIVNIQEDDNPVVLIAKLKEL